MYFRTYLSLLILIFLFSACSRTTQKLSKHHERYYQTKLCKKLGGKIEYVLSDKTRVDCLTKKYAIEVDFGKKWAEGIGQSLYYAEMTGKKPAVALIIDKKSEQRYLRRLNKVAKSYKIKVFEIKK